MTARSLLVTAAVGLLTYGSAKAAPARPNILFIMSDDHTTQGIGCYGSRLAGLDPTPTLDRLASEGMRFDRVFCTNANCTPSRATIMTGQYSQRNGVLDLMDKRWMYEEALRMPFIVRYPNLVKAGSTNAWVINNTDFAPTMLALAGAETPQSMQGKSFVGALKGEAPPKSWRKASYYRYWMHMAHNLGTPAHLGVRSDRHKLILFYGMNYKGAGGKKKKGPGNTPAAWEFYDLEKDPQEMVNQYGNPEYAAVIAELKAELKRQRAGYGETDAGSPPFKR